MTDAPIFSVIPHRIIGRGLAMSVFVPRVTGNKMVNAWGVPVVT